MKDLKEERTGIIYQAKCLVNGKSYIGQTIQKLAARKDKHLSDTNCGSDLYFHRAIRKHGPDNFVWTTIAIAPQPRLENLERAFVKTMNTFGSGGYNMTAGGEVISEQSGEKNNHSKLTEKNVIEIKRLLSEGELFQREIAEQFGVLQSNISRINLGLRWARIK